MRWSCLSGLSFAYRRRHQILDLAFGDSSFDFTGLCTALFCLCGFLILSTDTVNWGFEDARFLFFRDVWLTLDHQLSSFNKHFRSSFYARVCARPAFWVFRIGWNSGTEAGLWAERISDDKVTMKKYLKEVYPFLWGAGNHRGDIWGTFWKMIIEGHSICLAENWDLKIEWIIISGEINYQNMLGKISKLTMLDKMLNMS